LTTHRSPSDCSADKEPSSASGNSSNFSLYDGKSARKSEASLLGAVFKQKAPKVSVASWGSPDTGHQQQELKKMEEIQHQRPAAESTAGENHKKMSWTSQCSENNSSLDEAFELMMAQQKRGKVVYEKETTVELGSSRSSQQKQMK
jgi:hypothetical protein